MDVVPKEGIGGLEGGFDFEANVVDLFAFNYQYVNVNCNFLGVRLVYFLIFG